MTIAPLTPAPAPFPTTGAGAGSNPAGDFLAEMLDALAAPVAESPILPVVEPAETPAPDAVTAPKPFEMVAAQPPQGPKAAQPPQGPKAADPTQPPEVEPVETNDPTLAVCTGFTPTLTPGTAPRLDKLDDRGTPIAPGTPGTAPRLDRLDDWVVPLTPPTATPAPAITAPITAPPTAPISAPVAIPDQVFGAVTSLVSRGNGTHRITMTLQPELLGEVRVVLTVRDGAVHVRLAAGHEASAALLEGSPELTRLLEHVGATETRISVRELTPTPATPLSSGPTGGDQSPDRHAGTRADHSATDGDDPTRGHRSGGRRDVTAIRSVIDSRVAGVDLTM